MERLYYVEVFRWHQYSWVSAQLLRNWTQTNFTSSSRFYSCTFQCIFYRRLQIMWSSSSAVVIPLWCIHVMIPMWYVHVRMPAWDARIGMHVWDLSIGMPVWVGRVGMPIFVLNSEALFENVYLYSLRKYKYL